MSPISSVAAAFALSSAAPSAALDPDSAAQSGSVASHHLLGTGGLLFAVVALVSVAGYFHHGRVATKSARASNTWASFTSLFSSIRHHGATTTTTAAATDWCLDLEVGSEHHVSMVYARFFHPTFWNLVECHPATSSAPAIYVEDEVNEGPVSDSEPPGMNSFLDMDGDDDGGDHEDSPKRTRGKTDQGARTRADEFPPYDTSSPINVNFTSDIIGTTVRPDAFLSIPGELEDDLSESSSSDSISVAEELGDYLHESSSTDSEFDLPCSPYDGIAISPPPSPPSTRRHGLADMTHLAQSLKETIPEGGYGLVPTISHRAGLFDFSKFVEMHPDTPYRNAGEFVPVDDNGTIPSCDVGIHDSRNGLRSSRSDADILAAPHEGVDIMRRLLAELRDPTLDCDPRPPSRGNDSDYDDDDDEAAAWCLDCVRRDSLESTPSTPRSSCDTSQEGPTYPSTPPAKPILANVLDVHNARVASPVTLWFREEVQVVSPLSSDSPPSVQTKAYTRSWLYGPRSPLMPFPRL